MDISIYPKHSTEKQDIAYIRKVGRLDYGRIFTCLLSVGRKSGEEIIGQFRHLVNEAHTCDMEIIPDVGPSVFSRLGTSYEDLSIFREMYVGDARLGEGFDGMKESLITYNPQRLKLELNTNTKLIYMESIMNHRPDREKLTIYHDFYPQAHTGLSLKHFNRYNDRMGLLGLKVTASVSSNASRAYGPWSLNEGLYTLEMRRDFPLDSQVRHMFVTSMVDDVLIADAYATGEEFHACAIVDPSVLIFGIELEKELTDTEKQALDYEPKYVVRRDMSEYMIRSTWPRVIFMSQSIPAGNTRDLQPDGVVILNDGYLECKGELHIVTKDMPNNGREDVIGRLPEYEHILLDYTEPWEAFTFRIV